LSSVVQPESANSISPRRAALTLLGAWLVLDVLFNVRYPAPEPVGWYLLPSLDATALLGVILAWRGRRFPRPAVIAIAVLVVIVRLFRFGDGVVVRYFNRPLSLAFDLPLSGEIVRLLDATVARGPLLVGVPLAVAILTGIGYVAVQSIRAAERALGALPRPMLPAIVAVTALGSLLVPAHPDRIGLFGSSIVPRLAREVRLAASLGHYRAATAAAIDRRQLPRGNLEKLGGASVFLFLVESYGAAALERPDLAARMSPVYDRIESRLAGFHVASGLLDSPTYAGRSWLAQETLLTGVRAADRVADALVQERRPETLATFFRRAGYRTVFAQPANRYRNITRWSYDFEATYSGWDFDYRGPSFRWANMPDQYVVDFIHRREVSRAPVLIAYALQSSHAPWSEQPPVIEDWSRIGDGHVYATLPAARFPVTWLTLARGGEAYVRSLEYDLEVLARYTATFVPENALVIILGDHQPVAELTRWSPSAAVPVHVISRRRELVEPFLARGYRPGLRPSLSGASIGMETFLSTFLADFSR
jgi:hypothetical protein